MKDVLINVSLDIGFVGGKHKDVLRISREHWDSMTEDQRDKEIDEMAQEWMWNKVNLFWDVES